MKLLFQLIKRKEVINSWTFDISLTTGDTKHRKKQFKKIREAQEKL